MLDHRSSDRGQRFRTIVTVLVTAAIVAPVAAVASDGFSDVPSGHPFHDEITWIADHGITTGYDDGTFRPNETVRRQAVAAFLQRLAESRAVDAGTVQGLGPDDLAGATGAQGPTGPEGPQGEQGVSGANAEDFLWVLTGSLQGAEPPAYTFLESEDAVPVGATVTPVEATASITPDPGCDTHTVEFSVATLEQGMFWTLAFDAAGVFTGSSLMTSQTNDSDVARKLEVTASCFVAGDEKAADWDIDVAISLEFTVTTAPSDWR